MTFGEKLRALRIARRLTQEELASSLRITSRTLINYEQGRCLPKQTEVLSRIATLFNVTVDFLMNDEEEVAPRQERSHSAQTEVQHFINEASALFAGGMLSDEDRDYVVRAINDLYWESRDAAFRLNREPAPKKDDAP